jgi:hypothetical protein
MTTIVICSSASFFKQVVNLQTFLEKQGYKVIIPAGAEQMKRSGDYNVDHFKTWFNNPQDYPKKTVLIRSHNAELKKAMPYWWSIMKSGELPIILVAPRLWKWLSPFICINRSFY